MKFQATNLYDFYKGVEAAWPFPHFPYTRPVLPYGLSLSSPTYFAQLEAILLESGFEEEAVRVWLEEQGSLQGLQPRLLGTVKLLDGLTELLVPRFRGERPRNILAEQRPPRIPELIPLYSSVFLTKQRHGKKPFFSTDESGKNTPNLSPRPNWLS